MGDGLTPEQVTEIKEAFTLFDKNNDGIINADELGTVMRALGQNPTEAEIQMLVKDIDGQDNGTVDLSEMMNIMSTRMKPNDPITELREAFRVFDKDGKGFIESSHFRQIMMTMGEVLTPDEMDEMIRDADKDGEGKINYEEFVLMVTSK